MTIYDKEIHIKINKQQLNEIKEEAKKQCVTFSEFLRTIIREYLKSKR
jgi:predicted DNA binding CopG/RHH family protein